MHREGADMCKVWNYELDIFWHWNLSCINLAWLTVLYKDFLSFSGFFQGDKVAKVSISWLHQGLWGGNINGLWIKPQNLLYWILQNHQTAKRGTLSHWRNLFNIFWRKIAGESFCIYINVWRKVDSNFIVSYTHL